MRATLPRRGGFTLVELLVAVSIMLVLIGIALLVANSGIIGNARTSSGSDRIAGWLMQAREKAKRDGAPRGIRFLVDPATGYCREAQLIEVPEPYIMPAGYNLMIENSPGNVRRIYIIPDFNRLPATANALTELNNNVSVGDTLSIPSTGTIHRIQTIQAAPNVLLGGMPVAGAAEIIPFQTNLIPNLAAAVSTVANTPTYASATFGFLRQARPTFGEPTYQLPESVAIVVNPANTTNPTAAPPSLSLIPFWTDAFGNRNYDVLFGPNGEVQNTGGLGRIILWTANPEALGGNLPTLGGPRSGGDVRATYEASGEMRLVVVYTKTGAVAVQTVALPPFGAGAGPYDNTRDGIASGL